jgi:tRNA (guanine37-N1)-methyltransferase
VRIDVLTLFPEALQPYLAASILGRAQAAGHVRICLHQLRDYSTDPHKKVDDRPFGGGPGMVLMCQPVIDAVRAIEALDPRPALRILTSPQGVVFRQGLAQELAGAERLLIICGHYEGVDQRIIDCLNPLEISLGDFVLTGGELPALAMIDAVVRLRPGVLGNDESHVSESFSAGQLEAPHYTRPREYAGQAVPEVLLSGHHGAIARWRAQQSAARTRQLRPDLVQDRAVSLPESARPAPSARALAGWRRPQLAHCPRRGGSETSVISWQTESEALR